MILIYGQDDAVARWTFDHLGQPIVPPYVAIGVVDGHGWLVGGIVFNEWNGANLDITIYGPRALNRRTLRAAFRYAFLTAGATRLTAKTKRKGIGKLLNRLGFTWEGTMKDYYGPGDDALIFRLSPQAAAKWM